MARRFTVVLEQDGDTFIASVPQLPGCFSQGGSLDEVRANIREAIELYLEDAAGPFPAIVSVEEVEVAG